jgi:hypothetical protein
VIELDDCLGDGDGLSDGSNTPTWKRRKRKIKWAQGKGIKLKAISFCRLRRNKVCDRV